LPKAAGPAFLAKSTQNATNLLHFIAISAILYVLNYKEEESLMKKLISLLLIFVMVLGLCACSKTDAPPAAEEKTFRVGYARVNITPNYDVPLAGYGNSDQRMSNGLLSYLYATCIAITDADDSTVLLITMDFTGMYNNVVPLLRESITAATGVPAQRIMMNVTHAHSGPEASNTANPAIQKYLPELTKWVTQAATEAMADRSPATIETGASYTQNLNFVRHYTTTSGQIYGDNLSLIGSMTGHWAEPDNQIQLICFRRAAEDKKDILAVNWQAHPKLDSSGETVEGKAKRGMLSADYVGGARDYVESNTDYLFAFYLGAAGNLNANSKITSENYSTDCKTYSAKLGEYILEGAETLKPVATQNPSVTVTQKTFNAEYDHTEDDKVPSASLISSVWHESNNYTVSLAAAPNSGIYSPYHADSILSRSRITEPTRALELNAIRIGDIAFITAPYEMFDVNGMYVKENSPYDTTFVMSMANGANSYIAAEYAFEGQGTYEVHNRLFVKGTAEALATTFVDMLNSLK
jgi:hypothetical protein